MIRIFGTTRGSSGGDTQHTDTYTISSPSSGDGFDLGIQHNYRYIKTEDLMITPTADTSITYDENVEEDTIDVTNYASIKITVTAAKDHSDTYTVSSVSSGDGFDLGVNHIYRYIKTSNLMVIPTAATNIRAFKFRDVNGRPAYVTDKAMLGSSWDLTNYKTVTIESINSCFAVGTTKNLQELSYNGTFADGWGTNFTPASSGVYMLTVVVSKGRITDNDSQKFPKTALVPFYDMGTNSSNSDANIFETIVDNMLDDKYLVFSPGIDDYYSNPKLVSYMQKTITDYNATSATALGNPRYHHIAFVHMCPVYLIQGRRYTFRKIGCQTGTTAVNMTLSIGTKSLSMLAPYAFANGYSANLHGLVGFRILKQWTPLQESNMIGGTSTFTYEYQLPYTGNYMMLSYGRLSKSRAIWGNFNIIAYDELSQVDRTYNLYNGATEAPGTLLLQSFKGYSSDGWSNSCYALNFFGFKGATISFTATAVAWNSDNVRAFVLAMPFIRHPAYTDAGENGLSTAKFATNNYPSWAIYKDGVG